MNKKMKTFLEGKGFVANGNVAVGNIKGYDVTYVENMLDYNQPCKFIINCYGDNEVKSELVKRLNERKIYRATYSYNQMQFILYINDMTVGKLLQRLDGVLDSIFDVMTELEIKNNEFCPYCGESLLNSNTKEIVLNNSKVVIHEDCETKINEQIAASNAAFKAAPNNYLKGFLGALIGAAIGTVICIVLSLVGIVSAWSSIVGILLGAYFYAKFGGKQNKIMILMCTLTTFVLIAIGIFVIYVIAAAGLCYQAGYSYTGMKAFNYCLANSSQFKLELIENYALNGVFAIIGAAIEISYLAKKVKRPTSI